MTPEDDTVDESAQATESTSLNSNAGVNNNAMMKASPIENCGISLHLPSKKRRFTIENNEPTWYVCYECNSRFLTQEILDEHAVIHTGKLHKIDK